MSDAQRTKENQVVCRSCGYAGTIDTYEPSFGMYSDCRCPKCGSTNNEHNSEYSRRLTAAMREEA